MSIIKVFVAGATGTQGSAVTRSLITSTPSIQITSISRDTSTAAAQKLHATDNVTLIEGSFEDDDIGRKLATALRGCQAVFLNFTRNPLKPEAEPGWARNILEIGTRVGVSHFVFASAIGADDPTRFKNWDSTMDGVLRPKIEIEKMIRGFGVKHWTIIRPANFMNNFLPPVATLFGGLVKNDVWTTAYESSTLIPFVDSKSIGEWASAAILDRAKFDKKEINLADELLTATQVMEHLGRVVGKNLKAEYLAEEEIEGRKKTDFFVLAQWIFKDMFQYVDMDELKSYGVPMSSLRAFAEREQGALTEMYG